MHLLKSPMRDTKGRLNLLEITEIENGTRNKIKVNDLSIHNWYQFVLGYPPHLVRYYIHKFNITEESIILDPFCGTGTTPVEAAKNGYYCYGIEANPIAIFASKVKTIKKYDHDILSNYLGFIEKSAIISFDYLGLSEPKQNLFNTSTTLQPICIKHIIDLSDAQKQVIPKGFICPNPLSKVLVIKAILKMIEDETIRNFFTLALASFIVKIAGNIGFGPEIYRKKPKGDIAAISNFVEIAGMMIDDVGNNPVIKQATILQGDSRSMDECLPKELTGRIKCVITSPPYPNEKDYTRSTRLESVLLGYICNKQDLRDIKDNLLRSNSRTIFATDDDEKYIRNFYSITSIANTIEEKRISLKKTSGFEKLYHKIVLHYFGGMYRHLKTLRPFLHDSCKLAYVVGDQMSFFRILVSTAELLGEIAESLGYKVDDVELWRTRTATATRMQLNENVLILSKR